LTSAFGIVSGTTITLFVIVVCGIIDDWSADRADRGSWRRERAAARGNARGYAARTGRAVAMVVKGARSRAYLAQPWVMRS
jgi:hypothetical protein